MATGAAIASTALGLGQTIYGISESNKAKKAIEEFNRQELLNPNKDIQISTLKSDQQTDAGLSQMATSVDALQRGGTRAVLGGIPRISESNILLQNLISQDLENQDLKRDYLIAQGDERIRNIREQREQNALLGLGQQLQTSNQNVVSGINNILTGSMAIQDSLNLGGGTNTSENPFSQGYNPLTPNEISY